MKRFIILMMAISCAVLILAQDVISLKSGDRIENVKVLSITDSVIVYVMEGNEIKLPRNSVDAILYEDGRYEEIKATNRIEDTIVSKYQESIDENSFMQYYGSDGRLQVAFFDKTYSKECRKVVKKVYYKEFESLYKPAYKEAKKKGLSNMAATRYALNKILPIVIEDSDKAVRECAGEL